jgi:hypothetical protein
VLLLQTLGEAQWASALHELRHAPVPLLQVKLPQESGASPVGAHVPAPLQAWACEEAPPPAQTGAHPPPPAATFLHTPLPSHLPVLPHGLLGEVSSLQVSESVPSLATLAQAPLLLHFWQVPQALTEQHAPSTQLPELHWPPAVQAAPSPLRPQLPPLHVPLLQSRSALQVCRQTSAGPSHLKLPHDWVCMGGQAPAPSHLASSTAVLVLDGQLLSRQVVLLSHLLQLPLASHLPSFPQLVLALATHSPAGSTVPAATFLHVPTEPVTLQLLH